MTPVYSHGNQAHSLLVRKWEVYRKFMFHVDDTFGGYRPHSFWDLNFPMGICFESHATSRKHW